MMNTVVRDLASASTCRATEMRRTHERPLDQVLVRAWCDFVPEHPDREPWHQATLDRVDFAVTDNRRTANLRVADRVKLQGLGEPSWEQDWLEPGDWRRGPGWGVPAP